MPGRQRRAGSIWSIHQVKHQLALRALRLGEITGFKPVAQGYADDGESDHRLLDHADISSVDGTRAYNLDIAYFVSLNFVFGFFCPGSG
jgi:hypothetical protein